ncbi:hypothetical protein DMC47_13330 [Nostoc sp. 3335mG]|nr:hypothetical protein DMC47_13330 [Nostoc sp. 3335mG]
MWTTEMIARFWYANAPCDRHIALRLAWREGEATARVEAPPELEMFFAELRTRQNDEFMDLPIALSYAVLVAAKARRRLTITGDATVWPEEWGQLSERPIGRSATQPVN